MCHYVVYSMRLEHILEWQQAVEVVQYWDYTRGGELGVGDTKIVPFLTEEWYPDFAKFPIGCCTIFAKTWREKPIFHQYQHYFQLYW